MLYIMRHGRTEWNALHKLQGRTDIPLSADGREMAEMAAAEYRDVHFDVCFCSPLIRARETAEIVLRGRDVPIITDDRLVEMSFGIYEGFENCFEHEELPIIKLFKEPDKYETVENGESLEELFARTGDFLYSTAMPLVESGKDVLIVGHGAMNSSIVCRVRDITLRDFWSAGIENCKLMRLI